MHASPVKRNALSNFSWSVHQPATLKDDSARVFFEKLQPDCIIVVAYGKLLPPWLIRLPRFGVVNLHGSLLPKYRGAAPIQWALANGETETGVCTMQIDEGLDTGPVYLCEKTPIQAEGRPYLSSPNALQNSAPISRCVLSRVWFPAHYRPLPRISPAPVLPRYFEKKTDSSIGAGPHKPFTTVFGLLIRGQVR